MLQRFLKSRSGGSVLAFALATPALAVGVGATVEYSSLASRHSKLQLAADTAALAATKELSLANADDARIASVVASTVNTYISGARGASSASPMTITSQVTDKRRRVTVDISDEVNTFMGRVLSYPTFRVAVSSAAKLYGATKLCVLTLDEAGAPALLSEKNSKLTATQCSVFSNSAAPNGLLAKDNSLLRAERICLVGGYSAGSGNIAGTVLTDCPPNGDPLANRPVPSNATACDQTGLVVKVARALTPGVYCNGLKVDDGATVTLSAGTYVIAGGALEVTGGATLQGEGVGFYLQGSQATFNFKPDSTINLSAPKSGPMAGLLFFEDRSAPLLRTHSISSKDARRLLGTFYLSRGMLRIDANNPVADQSAYTVIVSRRLELSGSPDLVMNAMYSSTDVPVPEGVGPNGSAIALVK